MSPNINNTNHFKGSTSMRMSSQHRCRGKLYITIPLHGFATDYHTMPLHYHSIGLLYHANTWHQWTFQCNTITQRCTAGLCFAFALDRYATPMRCFNAPRHSDTMICRALPQQFHALPLPFCTLHNTTIHYIASASYDLTMLHYALPSHRYALLCLY